MKTHTVLFADNDPWALADVKSAYRWAEGGFQILYETLDPFDAAAAIQQRKPDVAIIDIEMGGMTGLSVIQQCRAAHVDTVFILLTAYDRFQYAKTAISLGVFEYLLKPIDEFELASVLDRVRDYLEADDEFPPASEPRDPHNSFQELLRYLHAHYRERITLGDLSRRFFLNKTYICDLFRKQLDTTLTEYINDMRLKQAYRLIVHEGASSAQAAESCGFNNVSYFLKLFKQAYGVSPSQLVRRSGS